MRRFKDVTLKKAWGVGDDDVTAGFREVSPDVRLWWHQREGKRVREATMQADSKALCGCMHVTCLLWPNPNTSALAPLAPHTQVGFDMDWEEV